MASTKRPANEQYYEDQWSSTFFQGDIFDGVPLAFPWPADVVLTGEEETERRFLSGPFDTSTAMLITPTCTMASQGRNAPPDGYSMGSRALVPIRPLQELVDEGAVVGDNVPNLRSDRLRNYFYVPENPAWGLAESVALLYQPTTVHHNVIADRRIGQLSGAGHRQFLRSLAFYATGARIAFEDQGPPAGPGERTS